MKKLLLILLLCLFPFLAQATMMTEFTNDPTPTTDDIFWTTNAPATTPADRKVTLGNLLLWMATQDWTFSGTLVFPDTITFTLPDASTLTLPAVASIYEAGILSCNESGTCGWTDPDDLVATIPVTGTVTTEQVACWEVEGSINYLKSCGTKTIDNSSVDAVALLCKDNTNQIVDCTLSGLTITGTTAPAVAVSSSPAITSGASPTIDGAGEIAVDTTTDQIQYYGGAKRVLPYIQYLSFVIPAPADTDDINIMKAPYGMTIIGINCIVQGTTSATGQIQECDSTGASCADLDSDIACDADGAADDGTLTDSTIANGAWLRWKTTSLSGTPTFLTVTVRYSVVAD